MGIGSVAVMAVGLVAVLWVGSAQAVNNTWIGSVDKYWHTDGNWKSGQYPEERRTRVHCQHSDEATPDERHGRAGIVDDRQQHADVHELGRGADRHERDGPERRSSDARLQLPEDRRSQKGRRCGCPTAGSTWCARI